MTGEYIIETRGLTKEFKGFVAVGGVDLKVRQGAMPPERSGAQSPTSCAPECRSSPS